MSFNDRNRLALAVVVLALTAAAPCGAEEIVLRDGRRITGTIVGYENDMFRVETEYGYALIRKDKVASVNMLAGGEKGTTKKVGSNPGATNPGLKTSRPGSLDPAASGAKSAAASAVAPARVEAAPPVGRPLDQPLPAHLEEHVEGNNYYSDTFHFVMYKPPGWKTFEELPREKVSAIVALSTVDETTLLFVDRRVWSGTPDLKNDMVEANLRETYQDYKKTSETETQMDGLPAVRRTFTGTVDGVEWHGVSVRVARGASVFGIIGLTSSEAAGVYEAIFNKIIKSFHFLTSAAEMVGAPRAAPTP